MRLTIRRKILSATLAMTLVTAALGEYAVHVIDVTGALVAQTYDHALIPIDHARAAAADLARLQALPAPDPGADPLAGVPRRALRMALAAATRQHLQAAADHAGSPAVRQAAADAAAALAAWLAPDARAAAAGRDAGSGAARDAAVDAQIMDLARVADAAGLRLRDRAVAQAGVMRGLTWAMLGLSLALSGLVALLLARRIVGPVRAASDAASAIAAGQLTAPIPAAGHDELGGLLAAMAVMRDAIRAMMEREVAQRRSAQGRLADALENALEGMLLIAPDGRLLAGNSRLAEFFPGLLRVLRPGTPVLRLIGAALAARALHPAAGSSVRAQRAAARAVARQLLRPQRDAAAPPAPLEVQLAGGRWLRISRSPTTEGGAIVLCSDITAAKGREQELRQANLYLDVALNNMIQGLCLFGPDHRLVLANRRFGDILGLPATQFGTGAPLSDILAASVGAGYPGSASLADLDDAGGRASAAAPARADRRAARRIQQLSPGRVVEIARAPLPEGGWVATLEDVTERRASEARIAFLARHDPLTNLPNRVQLNERLTEAVAGLGRGGGGGFAVMCVDLDHFKAVNETLGHAIGDGVLCAVAARLAAAVRETDTVARLGADEFAVIQADLDRTEDAWELAQRLLAALAEPFDIHGEAVAVAASLGIALAPADGRDAETLLRNAAAALTRAKRDGRGSYRAFEPVMDARLQARRAMELDLRRALPADEFRLVYQPLIDSHAQRVIGFEALVRWHHPRQGVIPPAAFIPLAEEIGLIGAIGAWVLRTACAEAGRWPEALKVAVNVSPMQFQDVRLDDVVAEALATSGLTADRLELEVTESVVLHNNAVTLRMLHRLHDMGVRIAMDDFGTGYSSLSYLRSFPFDKIKIDQSFVRDLVSSQDATAIIRAITALSASLGIRTTAEGVETPAQRDRLRAEGCTELQGYLFGQPIPPAQIPALLARLNGAAEPLPAPPDRLVPAA